MREPTSPRLGRHRDAGGAPVRSRFALPYETIDYEYEYRFAEYEHEGQLRKM